MTDESGSGETFHKPLAAIGLVGALLAGNTVSYWPVIGAVIGLFAGVATAMSAPREVHDYVRW